MQKECNEALLSLLFYGVKKLKAASKAGAGAGIPPRKVVIASSCLSRSCIPVPTMASGILDMLVWQLHALDTVKIQLLHA